VPEEVKFSHKEQRWRELIRNVCNAVTLNKLQPVTNLPSTSRYAVQDIPAISIVYFPVSSTFGLLMISLYRSFSFTSLYFDPGNNSCKKMGHFFLWKLCKCEPWKSHSGVTKHSCPLVRHVMLTGKQFLIFWRTVICVCLQHTAVQEQWSSSHELLLWDCWNLNKNTQQSYKKALTTYHSTAV
jgi:hypothetical protein